MHIPPEPSGEGREAIGEIRWPLLLSYCMALQTNVYIDGFNLYYGCAKGTPHRWLDLGALCNALLPKKRDSQDQVFYRACNTAPP